MKTNHNINPRRVISANALCRLNGLLWLCAVLGFAVTADAQTLICGNLSSQTWVPAGNPYIVTCDATVLSGETLTIQPGVVVWIGSNVTLTANGLIQAVGTPSQRITFQAPISSQYWHEIHMNYGGGINRFTYCDFQNANTALSMSEVDNYAAMATEIRECPRRS